MKYYFKRGKWCVRDGTGLHKFRSEEEAKTYVEATQPSLHIEMPKFYGTNDGEKETFFEKEKTGSDE